MSCSLPELTGAVGVGATIWETLEPAPPRVSTCSPLPFLSQAVRYAKTCTSLERASAVAALQQDQHGYVFAIDGGVVGVSCIVGCLCNSGVPWTGWIATSFVPALCSSNA